MRKNLSNNQTNGESGIAAIEYVLLLPQVLIAAFAAFAWTVLRLHYKQSWPM